MSFLCTSENPLPTKDIPSRDFWFRIIITDSVDHIGLVLWGTSIFSFGTTSPSRPPKHTGWSFVSSSLESSRLLGLSSLPQHCLLCEPRLSLLFSSILQPDYISQTPLQKDMAKLQPIKWEQKYTSRLKEQRKFLWATGDTNPRITLET